MRARTLAAGLLSVALLATSASAQSASDVAEIRVLRADFNAAIGRHDLAAIETFLEAEYHASTSNGAFLSSPAEMVAAFAARFAAFGDATYVRTPESIDVGATPVAWENGRWEGTWTTPEGPFRTGGRYSAYWRKGADGWRLHAELFVPLYCEGPGCT